MLSENPVARLTELIAQRMQVDLTGVSIVIDHPKLYGSFGLMDFDSMELGINSSVPTRERLIHTLVHELTHLEQLHRGDLKWASGRIELFWQGRPLRSYGYGLFMGMEAYVQLPWEADANARADWFLAEVYPKDLELQEAA